MSLLKNKVPFDQDCLSRLRSLLTHFTSEEIALALGGHPDVISDAIPAISLAMTSLSLPLVTSELCVTEPRLVRQTFERLRVYFTNPQFWIQSGFTKEQLNTIRLAFMEAVSKHDERTCALDAKVYESRRKAEILRTQFISKN